MSLVIVESSFDPPLTDELRQSISDRLDPCRHLRGVEWVQSFESRDFRRKICLFRAPDIDAVRESLNSAGVPYDRVWSASWREPDADDPEGATKVSI